MVKKQLLSGQPCRKCAQAEEMLRRRGYWERIDQVVFAVEGDPSSPGMELGAQHGVDIAPFFVVNTKDGASKVYKSVLSLMKECLAAVAGPPAVVRRPGAEPDLEETAARLEAAAPQEILEWGLRTFGAKTAISFSGAEDVVLIDMASKVGAPFSVFSLDTGRLHPETYRFIEKVRSHYGIDIELYSPQAEVVQAFVREKGLFSFYEDGHKECCGIRKVEPLKRALASRPAWVTGQRKDQSVTRVDLAVVQGDPVFSGSGTVLVKLNPLSNWTSSQVWAYIRENDVPYNELHEAGYVSIGCEPCTRSIKPGEHERAGRWAWELETQRECGLHVAE